MESPEVIVPSALTPGVKEDMVMAKAVLGDEDVTRRSSAPLMGSEKQAFVFLGTCLCLERRVTAGRRQESWHRGHLLLSFIS